MTDPIPIQPNKRDSEQVEVMVGMGASKEFIADHLHLRLEDLEKFYHKELERGAEEANLRVAETFFQLATDGEHPLMTIAWLKMRAPDKWSERPAATEDNDTSTEEEAREKLLTLLNRSKSA